MPFRRPGSKIWYVSLTEGGRTTRRSTGTTSRREAERLEKEWRRPVAGHLWDEVVDEYAHARPSARTDYAIDGMRPWFEGRPIESLTAADITRYKTRRQAAPGTLKKELSVLRAAINYCRNNLGWQLPDVTKGRMPELPEPRIRWLRREEFDRLLRAAEASPKAPWLAPFLVLGVNTGMRRNELLQLEWRQVDFVQQLIYLEPEQQKSGRYDTVPLNATAVAALQPLRVQNFYAARQVFPVDSVKRSFRTACRRAGIEDFRIHDLRHTCAAWLVQAGVPLRTVADILRHADIKTTMIYAHLAPEAARTGVAAIG